MDQTEHWIIDNKLDVIRDKIIGERITLQFLERLTEEQIKETAKDLTTSTIQQRKFYFIITFHFPFIIFSSFV